MTSSKRTTAVHSASQSIDASTLKMWGHNHDDLMVIDVRSGAEFDATHITGSYHVPLPLLSEHAEEFAARLGARVVLVCQSGNRAEQARKYLDSVGLASASVLAGGVPAYAAAGGSVVKGKSTWGLERQVRMAAGSLVFSSVLAGTFFSPLFVVVAGVVGAGLAFSATTNSCAMGAMLSVMPWNRNAHEPTARQALENLGIRP